MECRLKEKKCMEQRMGPLPYLRVEHGTIFQSVTVDLFGPIEYQGTVNKRQVGKGWGVMFVCTTTSAVHVAFVDTYSTDSFNGTPLIHVFKGNAFTIPVGQGRTAGSCLQADCHVELQRRNAMGGKERN